MIDGIVGDLLYKASMMTLSICAALLIQSGYPKPIIHETWHWTVLIISAILAACWLFLVEIEEII